MLSAPAEQAQEVKAEEKDAVLATAADDQNAEKMEESGGFQEDAAKREGDVKAMVELGGNTECPMEGEAPGEAETNVKSPTMEVEPKLEETNPAKTEVGIIRVI